MSKEYTPTEEFNNYPVEITATGDSIDENFFNNKYKDIYNRIQYLKHQLDTNQQDYDGLKENLNNNVGGKVADAGLPEYTGTTILANGDTHHHGLEKLDIETTGLKTITDEHNLRITSNLTKILNTENKIGNNATEADPFVFTSLNFITQGEKIKSILEKFDQYLLGIRRTNEFSYGLAFDNLVNNLTGNILGYIWDTFYDNTKYNQALTTATISFSQQEASGEDTYLVWSKTTSSDIIEVWFNWEISQGGSIEVRFHANGETAWDNMETYTVGKKVFQTAVTHGTNFNVKVKISGNTKVYNFALILKGT